MESRLKTKNLPPHPFLILKFSQMPCDENIFEKHFSGRMKFQFKPILLLLISSNLKQFEAIPSNHKNIGSGTCHSSPSNGSGATSV
jgi:hypothetical protein